MLLIRRLPQGESGNTLWYRKLLTEQTTVLYLSCLKSKQLSRQKHSPPPAPFHSTARKDHAGEAESESGWRPRHSEHLFLSTRMPVLPQDTVHRTPHRLSSSCYYSCFLHRDSSQGALVMVPRPVAKCGGWSWPPPACDLEWSGNAPK